MSDEFCSYNNDDDFAEHANCKERAFIHILTRIKDIDGNPISFKTCKEHYNYIEDDLIKMQHEIDDYCLFELPTWNQELNMCVMTRRGV